MKPCIARTLQFFLCLFALATPELLHAQHFVYTNNNHVALHNTVSAFSVSTPGALTEITGSPFETGGLGSTGFESPDVGNTIRADKHFLYVSNQSDISVFSINSVTGSLTAAPGSPFSTGGNSSNFGISLALTPNAKFLYAGNGGTNNLSAFSIASNGALTLLAGSPFPVASFPTDIKVSPNGQFLYLLFPFNKTIGIYQIASDGSLTQINGSPFATTADQGLDINCAGTFLFASEFTDVDVFSIAADGTLSPISGSPFGSFSSGGAVALNATDSLLYVSNELNAGLSVFNVAANGSLTAALDSPFTFTSPIEVEGLAVAPSPYLFAMLYGQGINGNGIASFRVGATGRLMPAPGSPFKSPDFVNSNNFVPLALAAFPPKVCH
jgi:6-phosphogluconolactonase (cycloisomerase 2 family)